MITGCQKYNTYDDLQFSIIMDDTISLSAPTKIKVYINHNMKSRIYFDQMSEAALIGILNHPQDSLMWTPSPTDLIPNRNYSFFGRVSFKNRKSNEHSIWTGKVVYITE